MEVCNFVICYCILILLWLFLGGCLFTFVFCLSFFVLFLERETEGVNGVTRIFWLISLHSPGAKALYFSEPSFVG